MSATFQIESLRDQAEREGWLETFEQFDKAHHGANVKDLVETVLRLEQHIAMTIDDEIDEPNRITVTPPTAEHEIVGTRPPLSFETQRREIHPGQAALAHGANQSQGVVVRNSQEVLKVSYKEETQTLITESKRSGELFALSPVTPETLAALLRAQDFDQFFVTHVEPFLTERKPLGNVHDDVKQCHKCERWRPADEMKFGNDPRTPTVHVPVWLCQECRS